MTRYDDAIGYIVFLVIGFSPFAVINMLWSEVGIFETVLPEGKAIGAEIGFFYNLANIAPLLYLGFLKALQWFGKKKPSDGLATGVVLSLSVMSSVLVMAFWKQTSIVGGRAVSVGIPVTALMAGVIGCTCTVIVFNFAAEYRRALTSAMSAGMALSGIFAAVLAILQTFKGDKLTFSVDAFVLLITVVLVCSLFALGFAVRPSFREEYGREKEDEESTTAVTPPQPLLEPLIDEEMKEEKEESTEVTFFRKYVNIIRSYHPSLFGMLVASTLNYFVLPGLMPYLVGKSFEVSYIITALQVSNMIGRLLCGSALIRKLFCNLYLLIVFQTLCFVYLVLSAVLDLTITLFTVTIIVCALFSCTQGYIVTLCYLVSNIKSDETIRLIGIMTQCGSLLGSWICAGLVEGGTFH